MQVVRVKRECLEQVNPAKFFMLEDMSELTYLNEASILYNLKSRYSKLLIYVSILKIEITNPCARILLIIGFFWLVFRLILACFASQ